MQQQRAREILRALVQGIDPFTSEELPKATILEKADVVRALLVALAAVEQDLARESRRSQLPPNIGKSWSQEEVARLLKAFHAGEPVADIATRHGRSVRGIESRLQKLGAMTAEERTTSDRFPLAAHENGAG
jgi:hypothetical protein